MVEARVGARVEAARAVEERAAATEAVGRVVAGRAVERVAAVRVAAVRVAATEVAATEEGTVAAEMAAVKVLMWTRLLPAATGRAQCAQAFCGHLRSVGSKLPAPGAEHD